MIKLSTLCTAITVSMLSSAAIAAIDTQKLKSIFPKAKIVSTIELKPNYFEIQLIEKNSIVKKTHFYTNASVDFIATKFVFTKPEEKVKYGITKPIFDYSHIKLADHATFTYGTGEERNYFLTIPSEKSITELKNIFKGNGFKNNVFLPFDTENYLQLLYNLPIFKGTNTERVREAKITIETIEKINADLLTEDQAQTFLTNRLLKITKGSSQETLNKMADQMQVAVELKSIYVPNVEFSILNKNKKTTQQIITKDLPQVIEEYPFTNQELTDNWENILKEATAYTIGSGSTKVFLFSDIDCPVCVSLDHRITNFLQPGIEISVLYIPIQQIHPNSLDKTRFIFSLPLGERAGMSSAIQGTEQDADLPREAISALTTDNIATIDKKISISSTLSRILKVTGTPTLFKLINTPTGKKLQVINPAELFNNNLLQ